MAATRPRGRNEDRRREPRARRAWDAADAAPLAHRLRGGLLRARRLGARLAGRGRARGPAARLCDSPREPSTSTRSSRAGGARVPRVRHASPDRDRLAAALARDPVRVAVGRGTRRRPLGRRGHGLAARLRRPGPAAGEHPQRPRARARALSGQPHDGAAGDAGALGARGVALGADPRRQAAARHRTATPRRRRSSSSSKAARRSSSGRDRHRGAGEVQDMRCGRVTSSRGRPARASPMRSSAGPKA